MAGLGFGDEELLAERERRAAVKINVVGVGGCGNNAINNLYKLRLPAKLIAMNTDAPVLRKTAADKKVLLSGLTEIPRGAHGVPDVGAKAMENSIEDAIAAIDKDVDAVIGVAGLGGGTGTGGLPVLFRELAVRRKDALRIAVVTLPFKEEGDERVKNAQMGLQELLECSDTVIPNANDVLAEKMGGVTMTYAFKVMDKKIARVVEALVRLQSPETGPGIINVDFSNVKRIMRNARVSFAGVGEGRRVYDAFTKALKDDYAETDLSTSHGMVLYYEGKEVYLDMSQIRSTINYITNNFGTSTVFFGIRPTWELAEVRASLIACGVRSNYVDEFLGGEAP